MRDIRLISSDLLGRHIAHTVSIAAIMDTDITLCLFIDSKKWSAPIGTLHRLFQGSYAFL